MSERRGEIMMKRRMMSVILSLAMVAGILSGCGSSTSGNSESNTPEAVASPTRFFMPVGSI